MTKDFSKYFRKLQLVYSITITWDMGFETEISWQVHSLFAAFTPLTLSYLSSKWGKLNKIANHWSDTSCLKRTNMSFIILNLVLVLISFARNLFTLQCWIHCFLKKSFHLEPFLLLLSHIVRCPINSSKITCGSAHYHD